MSESMPTAATGAATQARAASSQLDGLRIYHHSNLLYWWVVWLYGFICAALTYAEGVGIPELASSPEKQILFHPSPWLGISFIGLVLFVIIFTNVRARGIHSFVVLLVALGLVVAVLQIPNIEKAWGWVSLLRVHLNLAFYLTFSTLLLAIWLFVVVVIDHFSWWRFSPGQVIEEHRVGHGTGHAYNTEGMVVRRLPNDFFRHYLLGLGTGDFIVKPTHADPFEIHNVWGAGRRQNSIQKMVSTRNVKEA